VSIQPVQPSTNAPDAVKSLVLGIIGVVLCSFCAPFAWKYGKEAEAAVDASGGTLAGRGLATAGKILGMIGTVLLVIGVIVVIVVIIGAAAGSS